MYKGQKRPGTGFTKKFNRVIPRKPSKIQEVEVNAVNEVIELKPVQDKLSSWIVKVCFSKSEKDDPKKSNSILAKSAILLLIICLLLTSIFLYFKLSTVDLVKPQSTNIYYQRLPHILLGYQDQSIHNHNSKNKNLNGLVTFLDFSPLSNSVYLKNSPNVPKRAKIGYFNKESLLFLKTESCDFQKYSVDLVDSECLDDAELQHKNGERYVQVGNSIWIKGKF